jgi:hypothetical protein
MQAQLPGQGVHDQPSFSLPLPHPSALDPGAQHHLPGSLQQQLGMPFGANNPATLQAAFRNPALISQIQSGTISRQLERMTAALPYPRYTPTGLGEQIAADGNNSQLHANTEASLAQIRDVSAGVADPLADLASLAGEAGKHKPNPKPALRAVFETAELLDSSPWQKPSAPARMMPQGTRVFSNPASSSPRELTFTCDICRKPFVTPHHLNRHCTCLRRPPCTVNDAFGQCTRTKPKGRLPSARSARSGSTRTPCRSARAMCRWTLTRSMPFSASFPAALLRPED